MHVCGWIGSRRGLAVKRQQQVTFSGVVGIVTVQKPSRKMHGKQKFSIPYLFLLFLQFPLPSSSPCSSSFSFSSAICSPPYLSVSRIGQLFIQNLKVLLCWPQKRMMYKNLEWNVLSHYFVFAWRN